MKEPTAYTLQIIKALPNVIEYNPGSWVSSAAIRLALLQQGTFISYKAIGRAMGFLGYQKRKNNKGVRGYANVSIMPGKAKHW
jgi:hypothetical protein